MTEEKRIKIVLIGETGVGKTNLIQVAMGNPFQQEMESTISSSYYDGDIIINNKQYYYSLWDTAGQEAYRSLNKMFIKEAKIVMVVFAVDNKESFDAIDFWVNYAKETLGEEKYIMSLVANKSDLFEKQVISDDEIMKKGEKLKVKTKITSAMEDAVGFKQFLEQLIKDFVNNIGLQLDNTNTFSLKPDKELEKEEIEVKHKKKCC